MQRRERIDAPLHVGERLAQQREQPRPVVEVCGLGKNFDARLQVRREAFHAVSRQSRGMLKPGKRGRSSSICSQGSRRSEEHTSELQSLMSISYAVFCLKKKTKPTKHNTKLSM